jgi:hypothetical protein
LRGNFIFWTVIVFIAIKKLYVRDSLGEATALGEP